MGLNSNVWMPHFKFVLQTIAITYPRNPNDVSKKKYYEFIQNLPIFLPLNPIGKNFSKLLLKYPVTPYLSSRMSFMKWVHFIFNKINKQENKKTIEFYESLEKYYDEYKPKEMKNKQLIETKKKYIQVASILILAGAIAYFYKK